MKKISVEFELSDKAAAALCDYCSKCDVRPSEAVRSSVLQHLINLGFYD